jgi:hypothetical protein
MKRKTLAIALILALMFLAVAKTQFVMKVEGSFSFAGYIPSIISITSPKNNETYIDRVPLSFSTTARGFDPTRFSMLWGAGYGYSIDGQAPVSIDGNTTITGLSAGAHWLVVHSYFYVVWGQVSGPYSDDSAPVYFTVISTTPSISIIEPKNTTYSASSVVLNFTVDKPTSWLAYSLDNEANVSISKNTTLSGLPNGLHHITVYANSTANSMATSETICFGVEVPFPTTLVATAVGASVAIACLGLLVYFRKRKRSLIHCKSSNQR